MTAPDRADVTKSQPLFYGWYVVAGAFIIMTVSSGLGFYNLGVYLNAFVTERGFPVSATSGATAAFFVASGVTGLLVGRLIEKYDPRWSIVAGAFLSAFALLGAAYIENLWQLYAFHIVFGMGYSACALLPCTTLVARWFEAKRSIALSYASTGLSLGGILLTPLSVRLIEHGGMAGAAPWLAIGFFVGVVPIALLLLRSDPYSLGLRPDGAPPESDAPKANAPPELLGATYEQGFRSRFFILMTASFVLTMAAQVGAIAHQFRLVSERTSDLDAASLAVAFLATASIVGRLIGGQLLTKMSARVFVLTLIAVQAVSMLLFAGAQSALGLYGATIIFGLTMGNLLMVQPLLIAEAFGLRSYGRLYASSQFATTLGVALGPALMGILYGLNGGYTGAFFLMAAISTGALMLFYLAGEIPRMASLALSGERSTN